MHLENVKKNENLKKCEKMWKKTREHPVGTLGKVELGLCSSQPARDWKSCFLFFHFFILIIIFWIENYHSLFISVKFFHYFFIPVFPPFGIFIVLSFASKMVLGPWELPPGAFSRTLFVSFHFVSFLYCFGYFSFLCLENCPWKLSKGTCSRTLFAFFFRVFFRFG